MSVPELRRERKNQREFREEGDYVLYWMIAARRPFYNAGLEYAAEVARQRKKPLVVLEALRMEYPWAAERFHAFVIEGMKANQEALQERGVCYYPFVESEEYRGEGLLEALSRRAVVVVTDEFPAYFLPSMVEAAAGKIEAALVAVDSNGLVPLRAPEKEFSRAYDFRRYIHREFQDFLAELPRADPLKEIGVAEIWELEEEILERWPRATEEWLEAKPELLRTLPIDHQIRAVEGVEGGHQAARARFQDFLEGLNDYADGRNRPGEDRTSGLSPYLHFGHIGAAELFEGIREREEWSPEKVNQKKFGKNSGFWGMSEGAEAFVDQFWTWRELGFNRCAMDPEGYADYETLPDWAKKTLEEHADDPRPHLYSLEEFEEGRTDDELWNAAQNQLREEGQIHNYLRMLWGKKILHWSKSPREALEIMVELNNKYALDGRDPNSYSGIFWVLGRFDRAWGPEREIFGKIRYMTSQSTRRKFKVDGYIERYSG